MDRRTFLVQAARGGTGLGLVAVTSGCPYWKSPASGPVAAGNVRDVPVGYFALLKDHAVILARDGSGLYAMTSLCTHFRCDLRDGGKISAEGIACDCHGSRFGRNGEVLEGPAGAPLAHYAVNVSPSGDIVVLAGTEVKSDARTAPPVGM